MRFRAIPFFCAVTAFLYFHFIEGYLFITSLGVGFSFFLITDFIDKLGHEYPIKELLLTIASFQWIVGAKLSYSFGKQHHKYYMYVDEETYMTYIVPAVLLLFLGLNILSTRFKLSEIKKSAMCIRPRIKLIATYLLIIGVMASAINSQYSGSLSFVLFLSELLIYVGVGYLLIIYPEKKYMIFTLTFSIVFFISLVAGMFHNLLLISVFLLMLVISPRWSFVSKLIMILFGVTFMYVLQTVKKDYRSIVWSSKVNENPVNIFLDLVEKEFLVSESDFAFQRGKENEEAQVNNRLNQGWIISKTMDNVPKNTPFKNGKTIEQALLSALLPRFLNPNKAGSEEALENLKEITGIQLSNRTAMGLSIVGEFYANYAFTGGLIAMFIYGVFISLLLKFIFTKLGRASPLICIWFVLIFFQVVKAETDLIKILNHLVKSIILFVVIASGFNIILGFKLFKSKASQSVLELEKSK